MTAAATVRERPILFSGEMVRAILEGRKTQTRRVVIPQPTFSGGVWFWRSPRYDNGDGVNYFHTAVVSPSIRAAWAKACPFGVVGDRLWVRESFFDHGPINGEAVAFDERIEYRATEWDREGGDGGGGWKPSIHMPRWASRITLELTGVRVDRIQSITVADAMAEGIVPHVGITDAERGESARIVYRNLWDSLNERRGYSWQVNPWVWVVEFRELEPEAR